MGGAAPLDFKILNELAPSSRNFAQMNMRYSRAILQSILPKISRKHKSTQPSRGSPSL